MKINKNRKEILLRMSDKQVGKLIKMLITYELKNEIENANDDFVTYMFDIMKNDLDKQIDLAKRRKTYGKNHGKNKKENSK